MAYLNRGNVHSALDQFEMALKDYTQAIKLYPNFTDAYKARGNLYFNVGLFDEALKDYTGAIEIDPRNSKGYCDRAEFYISIGDFKGAHDDYDKAIDVEPAGDCGREQKGTAYLGRGFMSFFQEQNELAITEFGEFLKTGINDIKAYCGLAVTYFKIGDKNKAKESYIKALEVKDAFIERLEKKGFASRCNSSFLQKKKAFFKRFLRGMEQ